MSTRWMMASRGRQLRRAVVVVAGWTRPAPEGRLPSESGGTWRTTYLDADTRILRSQNNMGGPPTVYVLRKAGSRSMV